MQKQITVEEVRDSKSTYKQMLLATALMARERIDAKPVLTKSQYKKRKKKNKQAKMSRRKNR